jgi:hypothetical protein
VVRDQPPGSLHDRQAYAKAWAGRFTKKSGFHDPATHGPALRHFEFSSAIYRPGMRTSNMTKPDDPGAAKAGASLLGTAPLRRLPSALSSPFHPQRSLLPTRPLPQQAHVKQLMAQRSSSIQPKVTIQPRSPPLRKQLGSR